MRILHLAYEDPRQPGSGGGSVRTREINRRLSERHEITALVAGYRGATPRVEDGIRWVPIGPCTGTKIDRLAYFGLLGPAIRRHRHDLLIEDFGAPFSVGFAPVFTDKPVIASVQWLFAAQMRDKYHLPFDSVERLGLRFYDNFIAVSDWLSHTIRSRQPDAAVVTIPNGVEDIAFSVSRAEPQHLVFVGRLDIEQKGCDLLLESVARARVLLSDRMPSLIIVGDGPDRIHLERQAQRLGIADIVEFHGRVEGVSKYQLMASSYAVLMPSRFETFGMVAAEAQAAGAPVIAFDVGPLAEVAGPGGAKLVAPFDLDAFANQIVALVHDQSQRERISETGRNWARRYNWNEIALAQEKHYIQATMSRRVTDATPQP